MGPKIQPTGLPNLFPLSQTMTAPSTAPALQQIQCRHLMSMSRLHRAREHELGHDFDFARKSKKKKQKKT
jgi:hypothetical protein